MEIHDKDWAEQVATESPLQSIHHTLTLPDRKEHIIDVFKHFIGKFIVNIIPCIRTS